MLGLEGWGPLLYGQPLVRALLAEQDSSFPFGFLLGLDKMLSLAQIASVCISPLSPLELMNFKVQKGP